VEQVYDSYSARSFGKEELVVDLAKARIGNKVNWYEGLSSSASTTV